MYDVGPQLTDKNILDLESKLAKKLPDQHRQFLLKYNGGHPFPSLFKIQWKGQDWSGGYDTGQIAYFFAIDENDKTADFFKNHKTFSDRIPTDTLAIAYTSGGDLVLIGTEKNNLGKIYYWAHSFETGPAVGEGDAPDYSNIGFIANDFNQLMESLYDDEDQ